MSTVSRPTIVASQIPILILAGGHGTRISEETALKPKPMVEIGGIPLIVHIMRHYYAYGFNDFVICGGYRSFEIKKFFMDYRFNMNDLEVDRRKPGSEPYRAMESRNAEERWRVRVIDTGVDTMTGARVAQALDRIRETDSFSHFGLTYGDGLTDLNLSTELRFHLDHGHVGTVLGVKNVARYGELDVNGDRKVMGFLEKPQSRQGFISGGFFFFREDFREYLSLQRDTVLEQAPLSRLAKDGELKVFEHSGFWYAMDTLRDKNHLQSLWEAGSPPWVVRSKETVPSAPVSKPLPPPELNQ